MSTLKSNVIEPATGTDLTLGASGDLINVTSDTLQLNTWKDSGGNTLFVSDGSGNLSSINSGLNRGGGPNLIQSQTASNSASISFTSGIDSTYDKYMFMFIDIKPATNNVRLTFQVNATDGTGYNETMTTSYFRAKHENSGGGGSLNYMTDFDQSQGTSFQDLAHGVGSSSAGTGAGILYLFSPASTTYVKHFNSTVSSTQGTETVAAYAAGYINDTTAIDDIQFKMSSGNFDGKIKMYGCR